MRVPIESTFRLGFPVGAVAGLVLALIVTAPAAPSAQNPASKPVAEGSTILDGALTFIPGTGPAVKIAGREVLLSVRVSYLLHTLSDSRLLNREVRLDGRYQADGSFRVSHFYTVKNGKLYRVRYYCETCNIAALAPGNCVCCQQPTELQEIPVSATDSDTVAD